MRIIELGVKVRSRCLIQENERKREKVQGNGVGRGLNVVTEEPKYCEQILGKNICINANRKRILSPQVCQSACMSASSFPSAIEPA